MAKLWGGRFEAGLDKKTEAFGASITFDQKMARQDLKGSLAHVTMLASTGILTDQEAEEIKAGIRKVEAKYEAGQIEFKIENEDIHMNWKLICMLKSDQSQVNFIPLVRVTTKSQRICTCG